MFIAFIAIVLFFLFNLCVSVRERESEREATYIVKEKRVRNISRALK